MTDSLAIYGRARAFDMAGECNAAKAAYEEYAATVRKTDPKSADMAIEYSQLCTPRAIPDPTLSNAIQSIMAGDDARALVLLDTDTNDSPWVKYTRAVALADLHRVDDAAKAYDAARDRFALANDLRGRSISIYGRARVYHDTLRCDDAVASYREYAALVNSTDPAAAAMALDYARDCIKR